MKRYLSVELFFWVLALAYLAWTDPVQQHVSLCVFDRLGFSFCPGCGLGRSIAYLLDGELLKSWETHKLGIFALPVIFYRIIQLITTNHKRYGKSIPRSQVDHTH